MQISILGLLLTLIGTLPTLSPSELSDPRPNSDLLTAGLSLISLGLAEILAAKMPATPTAWIRTLAALALGFLAAIPILQDIHGEILPFIVIAALAAFILLTSRKP